MEKKSNEISNGVKPKILLGLTTTKKSDWRGKVKEIDRLGLKEIALFPTCLKIKERRELYKLLEETKLGKIPLVHLRDDFKKWEFEYLIKKFKTKVFNTHFDRLDEEFLKNSRKYYNKIYLENNGNFSDEMIKWFKVFPSFCFDASHFEDYAFIQKLPNHKNLPKYFKKYKIGCCHISAVREEPFFKIKEGERIAYYNSHWLRDLSELDYVKKYVKYLPPVCAIELENSLEEQLKVKKYLEKIISRK